ncbi:unnamed protein product [Ambrosiozyma monospora]|uniref:Unnamed protein product n=1 Tax=Ambrosiozyma monospora TaxID=43982 RepID=A0A9W6YSF5_AMBMO|nr:unnamed protein product [Ambrosiozyma monospora]
MMSFRHKHKHSHGHSHSYTSPIVIDETSTSMSTSTAPIVIDDDDENDDIQETTTTQASSSSNPSSNPSFSINSNSSSTLASALALTNPKQRQRQEQGQIQKRKKKIMNHLPFSMTSAGHTKHEKATHSPPKFQTPIHEQVPPISGPALRRTMKELKQWKQQSCQPEGIKLIIKQTSDVEGGGDILNVIFVDLQIQDNPIYPKNETYRLQFIIDNEYPFKPPQTKFITHDPYSTHHHLETQTGTQTGTGTETKTDNQTTTTFPIPIHPHIYSNGHICLNILYSESGSSNEACEGWTPTQTLETLAISIQSMLSGNHERKRPNGDEQYCQRAPLNPLKTRWEFHDDTV